MELLDIEAMAAWLRQRPGETDAAWIERLIAAFQSASTLVDNPEADRMGERAWRRFQVRLRGGKKDM